MPTKWLKHKKEQQEFINELLRVILEKGVSFGDSNRFFILLIIEILRDSLGDAIRINITEEIIQVSECSLIIRSKIKSFSSNSEEQDELLRRFLEKALVMGFTRL